MELYDISIIVFAAVVGGGIPLLWVLFPFRATAAHRPGRQEEDLQSVSMLFDGDVLQHASDGANTLYHLVPGEEDWDSVRNRLEDRFPKLPISAEQAPLGISTIPARHIEDTAAVCISREGTFLRLNLLDKAAHVAGQNERIRQLEAELENLKRASDTTPHAVWQVDSQQRVIWFNCAYADLYESIHKAEPQKEKQVFEIKDDFDSETGKQRISIPAQGQNVSDWYDVSKISLDDIEIYHAVNINAVVKSEVAQRNFVQTLAKTFAQLSIGLAIFDRNGQLALFNPALIDLTELPADFLSSRPTLMSFFDRIRENRRMPEPKNYASWRQQITEVIAAATDGRYKETWTLETGQTYRVNGRPHPDGAIAFLIEDITAEVSVTRNFRAELELGQSLMDSFDDAIAVFSSTGVLTFCNLAYRRLWGLDPENSFADVTINDSISAWQQCCEPEPKWAELSDFVLDYGDKSTWEMPVTLVRGDTLSCSVSRVGNGATIIRFSEKVFRPLDSEIASSEPESS